MPIDKKQTYPEKEKQSLLESLEHAINEKASEDNLPDHQAIAKIFLASLGYHDDNEDNDNEDNKTIFFPDGSGDRGIDYCEINEGSAEFIQCKTKTPLKQAAEEYSGPDKVREILRILSYLKAIGQHKEQNEEMRRLQSCLISTLKKFRQNPENHRDHFALDIRLLIGTKGLTDQAQEEFDLIKDQQRQLTIKECPCDISVDLITIDDVLAKKWKEDNTEWRRSDGHKIKNFEFTAKGEIIFVDGHRVFFAKALDFITAFEAIGWHIFEGNVRCQLRKSNINKKITNQIKTPKGIKDFYLLNNGLTILAKKIKVETRGSKKLDNATVTLNRPQIVNGLQTITTLHEAYNDPKIFKDDALREIFEEACYILVRVCNTNEHEDINKNNQLILATNNQNKMEVRNLRSNDRIQMTLEKQFARRNWFYQSKEFAFESYKSKTDSWLPFEGLGKTLNDFKNSLKSKGKRGYKIADSIKVARSQLAFIGQADGAGASKDKIFGNDLLYKTIFEKRAKSHASSYNYASLKELKNQYETHFEDSTPPYESLLLSYLLYQSALFLANREKRIKKEKKNSGNNEITDAKSAAPFVFVEIAGNIIFRKFGNHLYSKLPSLLDQTDLKPVVDRFDFKELEGIMDLWDAKKPVEIKKTNFLVLTWLLFGDLIDKLFEDEVWKEKYQQGSSKPSMLRRKDTRKRIATFLERWDENIRNGKTLDDRRWWNPPPQWSKKGSTRSIADLFLPDF